MTAADKSDPQIKKTKMQQGVQFNGIWSKIIVMVLAGIFTIGGAISMMVWNHASDGTKHENGEQKENRIRVKVIEEVQPRFDRLERRIDEMYAVVTRIEIQMKEKK